MNDDNFSIFVLLPLGLCAIVFLSDVVELVDERLFDYEARK